MGPAARQRGFATFIAVWLTQVLSTLGRDLTVFALTLWLIKHRYPHPDQKAELSFALATLTFCFVLPGAALSPLAGAWVDRHGRKVAMMVAYAVNALLSCALLALLSRGSLGLAGLAVLTLAASAASTFHRTAFLATQAALVPAGQLSRSNGMRQAVAALSRVLAPALAGLLLFLPELARKGQLPAFLPSGLAELEDGTRLVVALEAVAFAVAALTLAFLRLPAPRPAVAGASDHPPRRGFWGDLKEGGAFIASRPALLRLLVLSSLSNFFSAPMVVLAPLLLRFNLGEELSRLGLSLEAGFASFESATALGAISGGLAISLWGGVRQRRVRAIVLLNLLDGLCLIGMGLSPVFHGVLLLSCVWGVLQPVTAAVSDTFWQEYTPRALHGRVLSARQAIMQASIPVGVTMTAALAGHLNPGLLAAMMGTGLALLCLSQLSGHALFQLDVSPGAPPQEQRE